MRTPRRDGLIVLVLVLALAGVALLAVGNSGSADAPATGGAAGWRALLGSRPAALLGQRQIVVLRAPSLADRVRRAGGKATEEKMRAWTRASRRAQQDALARLAFKGAPISPELSYVRVLNGFSASLDARAASLVERDPGVAGVYPVRAAYPAAVGEERLGVTSAREAGISLPGFNGTGTTVALLDTGVDASHPFLRGRVLPGIDVVDPGGDASARPHPTIADRQEQHGTELAGLVVGARRGVGFTGVAPGALLLPVRVAGWQPDARGDVAVYARTDQLLAGLEAAVDPDQNGDAHDAARVAVVGVAEPFAAFEEGPLAQAAAGALALNTLVVAPVGNDGPAGPSFGSAAGPAGAPAALAVAALDTRRASRSVRVVLRTGLGVLLAGRQPLGGSLAADDRVTAPVVVVPAARVDAASGSRGIRAFFGGRGFSVVAGSAALLPRGSASVAAVREAAAAGALAILVDGPLPAGALGLDGEIDVPIVGLPAPVAAAVRAQRRAGAAVVASLGAAKLGANPAAGAAAAFSSRGLGLGGGVKPELGAPGVGLATSVPGRSAGGRARYGTISGSSAAAAVAGGAAALLVQARPDLDAAALKAALIGSAAVVAGERGATGAGVIDVDAAAATELVAVPGTIGLAPPGAGGEARTPLVLRNVSRRPLDVALAADRVGGGARAAVEPKRVRIAPGETATVRFAVRPGGRVGAPAALFGTIRLKPQGAAWARVPWALGIPVEDAPLLSRVRLSRRVLAEDAAPAVLSLVAGRVDGSAARPQLLAVARLDVELERDGRSLGRLARLRNLLPGRYAFGLTGRDPGGRKLPPGTYTVRLVAVSVAGGEDEATLEIQVP
jgi:subtilisin family serine protease